MSRHPPPPLVINSTPQTPIPDHNHHHHYHPHNNSQNMERVFYNLHNRITRATLRHTSHLFRSIIEHILLVLAVCSITVVLLSHKTFVYRTSGILAYHPPPTPTRGEKGGRRLVLMKKRAKVIPTQCLKSVNGWRDGVDVTHIVIQQNVKELWKNETLEEGGRSSFAVLEDLDENGIPPRWNGLRSNHPQQQLSNECIQESTTCSQPPSQQQDKPILFSFSKTKGFLLLPPPTRTKHAIQTQTVYIDPTDVKCFGEPFLQTIIFDILHNPDTVIYNWILALHHYYEDEENNAGYVYNARTQTLTDLNFFEQKYYFLIPREQVDGTLQPTPSSSLQSEQLKEDQMLHTNNIEQQHSSYPHHFLLHKLTILLTSISLFFITTTLVSFTLRQTQSKMLEFTIQLSDHVRRELPLSKLVVVHVVENCVFVPIMVGVVFFLIEFYMGDKFLAFMVLSLVWIGEAYSLISMRSIQTTKHFPCAFFLYFTLFHVYFFSCPFGFSYSALGSTSIFVLHAMIFFLESI
uniref:Uncharacterized protein n=1 Tax=Ditylum brightwellii TaxID=49249 RepID=A0A7S4SGL2_9STRA